MADQEEPRTQQIPGQLVSHATTMSPQANANKKNGPIKITTENDEKTMPEGLVYRISGLRVEPSECREADPSRGAGCARDQDSFPLEGSHS